MLSHAQGLKGLLLSNPSEDESARALACCIVLDSPDTLPSNLAAHERHVLGLEVRNEVSHILDTARRTRHRVFS